jgi:hypothetical protein
MIGFSGILISFSPFFAVQETSMVATNTEVSFGSKRFGFKKVIDA